jgi:hypothetical protein
VSVSKELSKYKLDILEMQEVRWQGGSTESAEHTFFYRNGNVSPELDASFCA